MVVGCKPVNVELELATEHSSLSEKEGALKNVEGPGFTRIEAGGSMFFPYGHGHEEEGVYLSIQVIKSWICNTQPSILKIHPGNGTYANRWEKHPLHPVRNTHFRYSGTSGVLCCRI